MSVTVRAATAADLDAATALADWAKVDRWREGARSLVATADDGTILGTAIAMPNRVHAVRAGLLVAVAPEHRRRGIGSALVGGLRRSGVGPFAVKADEDTDELAFWRSLDAESYQVCPPQRVDAGDTVVQGWARRHAPGAGARPEPLGAGHPDTSPAVVLAGTEVPFDALLDAITDRFVWQHASWSPVRSRDAAREAMDEELRSGTDLAGTRVVMRGGALTAVCDLYTDEWPGRRVCCAEAVDPALPHAREDVASVMAGVLAHVGANGGGVLEFDGHVTDPHFAPLLRTIPGVTGRACHLLEVP